jgi:hypothetical protein
VRQKASRKSAAFDAALAARTTARLSSRDTSKARAVGAKKLERKQSQDITPLALVALLEGRNLPRP